MHDIALEFGELGLLPKRCPYCNSRSIGMTDYSGEKTIEYTCGECNSSIIVGKMDRCPHCNSNDIEMTRHFAPISNKNGRVVEVRDIYTCNSCGNPFEAGRTDYIGMEMAAQKLGNGLKIELAGDSNDPIPLQNPSAQK